MSHPVLLLALLVSSQPPMDTGAVVQACRRPRSADTAIELVIWNASARPLSDLRIRLHLQGEPGSLADLGWHDIVADRLDASGMPSSGTGSGWATAPQLVRTGCTGDTCAHQVDLDLQPGLVLAPLAGFQVQLTPARISGGALQWEQPTRLPAASDWSFSNLSTSDDCADRVVRGRATRATRIELFSQGTRVWGNAPGESSERPAWPLFDTRRSSFSSISRVLSDSVATSVRDGRNQSPGRWLVNQAGYRSSDLKSGRARVRGVGVADWSVIDSTGRILSSGTAAPLGFEIRGRVRVLEYDGSVDLVRDSTGPLRSGAATELVLPANLPAGGPYRIASPGDTSAPFRIEDDLYGKVRDATLRFFGVQRSGRSSSWFRPSGFSADPVPGGWYDCGDRLKEGLTVGYALEVLGALAATRPDRDPDRTGFLQSEETPDGIGDLVRELRHGAEYALASWDLSGGSPADMVVNVGDARDHMGWTHDLWIDRLPATLGGPDARVGRREMDGDIAGAWAAGLAFSARLQADDPSFADRALTAARGLYAWGKANPKTGHDTWYSSSESTADLALAAVALLWATRDTAYLADLFHNDSIAPRKATPVWGATGGWLGKAGGWALAKTGWMMDYDNPHMLALFALQGLILTEPDTAARYGVPRAEFDSLRSVVFQGAMSNAVAGSNGDKAIALPSGNVGVDSAWGFPYTPVDWGFNRYMSGYLADLQLFVEMARDVRSRPTGRYPAGTAIPTDSLEAAVVRGMDYILGLNPWDISFLMGIGSKNMVHPHHRTADPEGSNIPAGRWPHRTPVGAVMGGVRPDSSTLRDDWHDYSHSETCLDFATTFLVPATLLAAPASTEPTALRGRVRGATAPRIAWDPRRGTLSWQGSPDGFRWEVVDGRGRILTSGAESGERGSRSIELPGGIAFLRWTGAGERGSMRLLRLPR